MNKGKNNKVSGGHFKKTCYWKSPTAPYCILLAAQLFHGTTCKCHTYTELPVPTQGSLQDAVKVGRLVGCRRAKAMPIVFSLLQTKVDVLAHCHVAA